MRGVEVLRSMFIVVSVANQNASPQGVRDVSKSLQG
jgi:hypothetical protein